ncbi:MAG: hypothetical protein ACRD1H_16330, partial [Vicinamibacterales bacterium]
MIDKVRLQAVGGGDRRFAEQMMIGVRAIAAAHRRRPFDLLHALWLHEPGTVAVAAGTILRVPVVTSIGGAEVVSLPRIEYGALRSSRGRLMTANVLQRSTLVTGGSTYVLDRGRQIVPHRPAEFFRLAPLPVDTERFKPSSTTRSYDPLAPRLLHAGSLIPVKDQSLLLRAFWRVLDEIPGARLTVAGEDPIGLRAELE